MPGDSVFISTPLSHNWFNNEYLGRWDVVRPVDNAVALHRYGGLTLDKAYVDEIDYKDIECRVVADLASDLAPNPVVPTVDILVTAHLNKRLGERFPNGFVFPTQGYSQILQYCGIRGYAMLSALDAVLMGKLFEQEDGNAAYLAKTVLTGHDFFANVDPTRVGLPYASVSYKMGVVGVPRQGPWKLDKEVPPPKAWAAAQKVRHGARKRNSGRWSSGEASYRWFGAQAGSSGISPQYSELYREMPVREPVGRSDYRVPWLDYHYGRTVDSTPVQQVSQPEHREGTGDAGSQSSQGTASSN